MYGYVNKYGTQSGCDCPLYFIRLPGKFMHLLSKELQLSNLKDKQFNIMSLKKMLSEVIDFPVYQFGHFCLAYDQDKCLRFTGSSYGVHGMNRGSGYIHRRFT